MLYLVLSILLFLALVIPMGRYMYKIADNRKTLADPVFDRVDNFIYKICRIDRADMSWQKYAISLLVTNVVLMFICYLVVRIQGLLFLNPNGIGAMESTLSFHTIVSFTTNSQLQHYSGESGLSYLSQIIVIQMLMFTSAATGYAACVAAIRGYCGKPMGNYFVDMVRYITRLALPYSILLGLALIALGSPQTLSAHPVVVALEGSLQEIPIGPIASMESIKHIGTNGGGFLGANSATTFENPNIISNMLEMFTMMIIPGACVITFGLMFWNKKREDAGEDADASEPAKTPLFGGEAKPIFIAMMLIFVVGLFVCYFAESAGNPVLEDIGIDQSMGSYEGKETRFGIAPSVMFATVTTAFTTGTVNNMHDSLTPIGGLVPLLNMMMPVFGGLGNGLMNMLKYVIITVFLCGLMIGRTPEYLGKKIEVKEVTLAVLYIILHPLLILGFSAVALLTNAGTEAITNPGYHGFSQVLYEYSSAAANNGSGFEGLDDDSVFYNITTGIVMFFGRYLPIILQLAIAGSLLAKKPVHETIGTLRTSTVKFGVITALVVVIISALTFFPALSLGPIAEHLTLGVGR